VAYHDGVIADAKDDRNCRGCRYTQRGRPNAFCPSTPPPTTPSTSSATSSQRRRTERSEPRPCRHGARSPLLHDRDCVHDLPRLWSVNVTMPQCAMSTGNSALLRM